MENKDNFNPEEEEVVILLDDDVSDLFADMPETEPAEAPVVEPVAVPIKKEEKVVAKKEPVKTEAPVARKVTKVTKIEEEYEDEEDEEDDDDDNEGGIFGGIVGKMLIVFGAAIVVLAILVGIKYLKPSKSTVNKVDFASVGSSFATGELIGGNNVKAITDSRGARLEVIQDAINSFDYDEVEEETGITTIDVTLTSILKDLKIKFVNKKNKLIAGVPFKVEITKPDGSVMTVLDEDKDGIIYLAEIDGGSYTVKLDVIEELTGYYDFTTNSSKTVSVKTQLDYKKVDVSNEVKTATEEVAKKEDTKQQETVEESKKADTVAYVVSSKTTNNDGYVEIDKSQYITDPLTKLKNTLTQAFVSRFVKMADHEAEYGTPTSLGNGKHEKRCIVEGCDDPAHTETDDCTDNGSGACSECGATLPSTPACEHTNKTTTYVKASDDTHTVTVTCDACHEKVSETTDKCEWAADGKCVHAADGCTNTKPAAEVTGKVTITAKDSAGAEKTILPLSTTDASKNKGTLTAKIELEGVELSKFKDIAYSWSSSDESVIKITENSKEQVAFEVYKKGKATITCNVTGKAADASVKDFSLTNQLPLEVGGVTITATAEKYMVLVGESTKIEFTVVGGATNKLDLELNPAVAGGFAGVIPSEDTKSYTINGLKPGSFELILKSKDDTSVTKKVTVYVYADPKKDTATKLTTDQGKQVYKKSGDKFVEATVSDYYSDAKLYVGGTATYKYTGWWTIDGKTYYFDANGKKVTGNQVILGAEYTFDSNGVLTKGNSAFGIDVSTWNGSIDWNKVGKSGVTYAIIRCGFRGSTEGGLYVDNKFANNIKNATAEGIKVGVYFFTQAVSEAEAIEEASMCIGLVEPYKLSYPIFIDVESSGGRADGLNKEDRTKIIKAFCKTVTNAGYKAGVYANKNWFTTKINATELTDYTIWLAQYAKEYNYSSTRVDMWQYSASGKIEGISGNVDLNVSYIK